MSCSGDVVLVLFGPPGSGKGTQAHLLRESLGVPHISTGDMLRRHIEMGDELGHSIQALMRSGKLVPDELVTELLKQRIAEPDCRRGFILDGYPRTCRQATEMESMLEARQLRQLVIHLLVDYNKVIARLAGRRQCPVCGTLYNLASNPPHVPNRCDRDGAELTVREDDREEVIRARLEEYERQTSPVLNYFAGNGRGFHEVNASDDPPEVIAGRICALVENA
jgi:adenylate kinase